MTRIFLTLCFAVVLQASTCFAEDAPHQQSGAQSAVQVPPELMTQNPTAWQNIKDFDDTALFAVAGPPTAEDAERAKADTQLYEDMVDNFDDLEDEDDDYLFVIEALFDPEDSSRPASLRMDDEDADDMADDNAQSPNLTSSIYIDTVRPTFFPGFQIKPRELDPDKKDNADARSLFADLNKPRVGDILSDDEKPILPGSPPAVDVPPLPGTTKDGADDKGEKAGKINAPPKAAVKSRPQSPDEETLGALKQAVKELGLEKKLNLGKGAGGHEALENTTEAPKDGASTAPDVTQQKKTPLTAKQRAFMKKKMRKQPRRRAKPVEEQQEEAPPPPPPKESGGLLDDLF